MTILPNGIAVLDGGDALSREVAERGLVSDLMVPADIIPILKPGMWIIDGGAALGDHTRAYLDSAGPTGIVFAFEPHPEFFKCLVHNCGKSAICCNQVLWNERGVKFYHHSGDGNVGAGQVNQNPNPSSRLEKVYGPFESVRIDDLGLSKLDYMKLDIEGTEWFAMDGGKETIQRCKPIMVLEMNPGAAAAYHKTHHDIYALLDGWGYSTRALRNSSNPRCDSCDIIAWHKDSAEPWNRLK